LTLRRGRHLVVLLAIALVGVAVLAATLWDRIAVTYHVHRLASEPDYLAAMVDQPTTSAQHRAILRWAKTESGRTALWRELGLEESPAALLQFLWPGEHRVVVPGIPSPSLPPTPLSDQRRVLRRVAFDSFTTSPIGHRAMLRTMLQDVAEVITPGPEGTEDDRLSLEEGLLYFWSVASTRRPPDHFTLRTKKYNSGGAHSGFSENRWLRTELAPALARIPDAPIALPDYPDLDFRILPAVQAFDRQRIEDDPRIPMGLDPYAVLIRVREPDAAEAVELIARLGHADASERARAALLLSRAAGTDAVVDALRRALEDDHRDVGKAAAYALKRHVAQSPRALEHLRSATRHARAGVRERAVRMLWELEEAALPALATLIESLGDSDSYARNYAVMALRKFGPVARDAVPRLIGLLEDPVDHVRKNAATALERIAPDDPTVRAALERVAR